MNNDTNLNNLYKSINFNFKNEELLIEALTHRSHLNEVKDVKRANNERLEFLGDAVLELIITELLFEEYPEFDEGILTSFRSALVRTESLADEAKRLDIGKYIFMSKGEEATGGRLRPYILANTFEAIIGAMYRDQGMEPVVKFIKDNLFYKIQQIVDNRLDIDPKSKLQEISQDRLKITPAYELVEASGPDHNKKFKMAVKIGDNTFAVGDGESKQSAEQDAARIALEVWSNLEKKFFGSI